MSHHLRRTRGAVVVAAVAAVLAACGSPPETGPSTSTTSTGPPASSGPTTTAAPASLHPPAVPATGAYLGAWLHPVAAGSGGPAFAVEQRTIPAVQSVTGRPLAILHVYSPWRRPAPVANLEAISANGSIPLLDWGCAGDGAAVAGGTDDALITAYADTLKSYGKPVFLRWCWEMNLVESHADVGGPSGFVSAWIHIWELFRAAGATNVSFVWCPAVSGADPAPYYPGDAYVDWIGIDGYDLTGTSTFANLFSGFYQQWAAHGKPMMVAETGATSSAQAPYLESIGSGMPALPAFKAVVYFDASGPRAGWELTGDGLAAFGALARDPYFAPT